MAIPKAMRLAVVERDESTCQRCGNVGEIGWYADMLCIHHIDGNSARHVLDNLVLLCRGCHSRLHHEQGDIASSAGGLKPKPDLPYNGMDAAELRRLLHEARMGRETLSRKLRGRGSSLGQVMAWVNGRVPIPPERHAELRELLTPERETA